MKGNFFSRRNSLSSKANRGGSNPCFKTGYDFLDIDILFKLLSIQWVVNYSLLQINLNQARYLLSKKKALSFRRKIFLEGDILISVGNNIYARAGETCL